MLLHGYKFFELTLSLLLFMRSLSLSLNNSVMMIVTGGDYMLKNNRNNTISLRKRKSMMDFKQYNMKSFFIIGMILMVLILSILCIAAYPNSNMLAGI